MTVDGHQPPEDAIGDPEEHCCLQPGCTRPDCQLYRQGWNYCLADVGDVLSEMLERIRRGELS